MTIHLKVAEKGEGSPWAIAILRWSLIVIFLWFGCMKFTAYEAHGISGLIQNSPIMGWLYTTFGERGASKVVGVLELTTMIALVVGAFVPLVSALGAAMSSATYLITLSFMFSTPGVTAAPLGGFPWLSGDIGQFLLKDLVLLAASLCLLRKSLVSGVST